MKNKTLKRLKHTAKLEALIANGVDYETVLKQSQKIDKYITEEMLRINAKHSKLKV